MKAQYYKNSVANFVGYTSTYGATGVAEPIRVGTFPNRWGGVNTAQGNRIYSENGKAVPITTGKTKTGYYAISTEQIASNVYEVKDGLITVKGKQYPVKLADGFYLIRKLSVVECKRLQTVPEWYQFPVSDSRAYMMLGNGWTCEVITHLIKGILEEGE